MLLCTDEIHGMRECILGLVGRMGCMIPRKRMWLDGWENDTELVIAPVIYP